jgi:hypothetical protein
VEPSPFDETLFELMRSMTPEERLLLNDRTIQMIEELRRGFAAIPYDPARDDRRRGR